MRRFLRCFRGSKPSIKIFHLRFVRRGRASHRKKDLDDDLPSDWEELESDVENKEELREWLTTQNCKSTLLPHNQLVRKYLPPGTVMDLFEHYKSTQTMLGCHCVAHLVIIRMRSFLFWKHAYVYFLSWKHKLLLNILHCRYGTFLDVYKRRWQDILRFRQKTLFTACEICSILKQQLGDRSLGVEGKLDALQQYRFHLHSQYRDRCCLWQLQSQSSEPNCEILFISTDGLDQAKFALPRHPDLRANAAVFFGWYLTCIL